MTTYTAPLRYIFNAVDVDNWQRSPACDDFSRFLLAINAAIKDKANNCPCDTNESLKQLILALDELSAWIDSIKPSAQPMRYGNKSFRLWHSKLVTEGPRICAKLLPTAKQDAVVELLPYLLDSFGNATRIDYGTGHEAMFMMLIYCLAKLGLVAPSDLLAVGTKVFTRYIDVVHKLQRTYWLEPAGSHGVWSLDDYQFLVFLFGSSQLHSHANIRPRSVLSADVREGYGAQFMYLAAVQFVVDVKVGAPFAEHSPILNDIAALPTWAKVNEGLFKMYRAEVLGKLPVVQHFVFGSLLQAAWVPSRDPVPSETMAHALAVHAATPRAAAEAREMERISALESVPVDDATCAVAPWVTSPPAVTAAVAASGDSTAGSDASSSDGSGSVMAAVVDAAAAARVSRARSLSGGADALGSGASPLEGSARLSFTGSVTPVKGDGVVAFLGAFGAQPQELPPASETA